MTNTDNPFGLKPVRYISGAPYNGAVNAYFVPSSDSTALYIGDPVVKTGTANTAAHKDCEPGTLPVVTKATAATANAITGVIVSVEPVTHESAVYREASVDRIVYVADDPGIVFQIQDDAGATLAATDVGGNANLVFTHSGNTNTGLSGAELDASAIATTAAHQLNILRLAKEQNNALGNNAIWEVKINNHTEINGAAGI